MNGHLQDINVHGELLRGPAGAADGDIERVGHHAVCSSILVAAEIRWRRAEEGSFLLTKALPRQFVNA